MKERIEKKLNENIERILNKEELLASDVAILEEKLKVIKEKEIRPVQDAKLKEMLESGLVFDKEGE